MNITLQKATEEAKPFQTLGRTRHRVDHADYANSLSRAWKTIQFITKTKDGTGRGVGTRQISFVYPGLKQKKIWLENNG